MVLRLAASVLLISVFIGCSVHTRSYPEQAGYAIQVGAFYDVKNAEKLTTMLQEKGIEAFYFKKEDGFFAVRFGSFATKENAENVAKKLISRNIISDYFIAPPRVYKISDKKWGKSQRDNDIGMIIAKTAERFIGIPYKWGGNNVVEGLDCSGFVKAVYNLCGINLPRTAKEQFSVGIHTNKNEMSEGDLVFFGNSQHDITHVGIYVGRGYIVHAPKRGDVVKKSALDNGYFSKKFVGARRYF